MSIVPIEDLNSKKTALNVMKAGDWISVENVVTCKIEKITGNKITVLFLPETVGGWRDNLHEYLGDTLAGFPIDDVLDRVSAEITYEGHPNVLNLKEKIGVQEPPAMSQGDVIWELK